MPRVVHYIAGVTRPELAEDFARAKRLIHSWIHVAVTGDHPLDPEYRAPALDGASPGKWRHDGNHQPRIRPGERVWFHIKAVGSCENGFPYLVVSVDHLDTDFAPSYEYRLWLHRVAF